MGKISKIFENAKNTIAESDIFRKDNFSFEGLKTIYRDRQNQKRFDNDKNYVGYTKVPNEECFVNFIGKDENTDFVYIKYNDKFDAYSKYAKESDKYLCLKHDSVDENGKATQIEAPTDVKTLIYAFNHATKSALEPFCEANQDWRENLYGMLSAFNEKNLVCSCETCNEDELLNVFEVVSSIVETKMADKSLEENITQDKKLDTESQDDQKIEMPDYAPDPYVML